MACYRLLPFDCPPELSTGLRLRPPLGTDITKTSNVYASTRSVGFGPEVQKRMLLGTYALTAE